ncbi:MAG: hypothetical protein KKB85_02165 [Candidatus Altiarchaeota archaeon]|nr:hypothetical protein [Candidatus Altiarchaeota archaeon]
MIQPDNTGKPAKGRGTKPLALAVMLILFLNLFALQVCARGLKGDLLKPVVDETIRGGIRGAVIRVASVVKNFLYSVYDNLILLILANPPITAINGFMGFFIRLAQPFYVLAITLLGFQLLFISTSPEERARVKMLFGWLLASLVMVSLSPLIMLLLMETSRMFATVVLGIADPNLGIHAMKGNTDVLFDTFKALNWIGKDYGVEIAVLDFSFLKVLYFILMLRYMMVGLWGILLPVTLFFYSIKASRGLGKSMFAQTIMWTFMQVAWSIGLIAIAVSFAGIQEVYPQFPLMYIHLASFFLFFASPMVILGVMGWLEIGFHIFGTMASAPVSRGVGFVVSASVSRGLAEEEEVIIKPVS